MFEELMATGRWGEQEIKLGIEFDFKCAYCDKDMLASVENHKEWQTDHIVPSSKNGSDCFDNYALSCRTCNFIKGRWNPLESLGSQEKTKSNLIELSKSYVFNKRAVSQSQVNQYKRIVDKYR